MTIRRYLGFATKTGIGLLVIFCLYVIVVFFQVRSAANNALDATPTGDAIVVLGAAQYNGEPSPVLAGRLDKAFELFENDAASTIVTTGANQPGDVFTEAYAGYEYLVRKGVADDDVVVVVDGTDTYESLRAASRQLPDDARIVIVTDAYHAKRSAAIAQEVGLDPVVVAAGDDRSFTRLSRETAAVVVGRFVSFGRLSRWS